MNKKNILEKIRTKSGFTLIEIVVVVGSLGIIVTAMVGVILGTFRAQNRIKSANKVMENGIWITNQLRKTVFNSQKDKIVCNPNGLSVVLKDNIDDSLTTISCDKTANKIASASATREYILNNSEVNVTNCIGFVVCEKDSFGLVTNVVFSFDLGAVTAGVSYNQNFKTSVTVRN
jgi:type II secretory pathway pseudopilin PulG